MPASTAALDLAIRAVADAARVARAVQRDLEKAREITKDDKSPVTVADFAVQAVVNLALIDADPSCLIVGEEDAGALRQDEAAAVRAQVVHAVRQVRPDASEDAILEAIDRGDHDATGDAYWTLDPVDGTKGFLRGEQYAIALGRIESGVVVAGVLGCPNLAASDDGPLDRVDTNGALYAAERGRGAFAIDPRDPGAPGRPIHAAPWTEGEDVAVCESVEKAHTSQSDSARIIEALGGSAAPVRIDSQCKYAVVARGGAHAYLRLPTKPGYVERIWDHAAGSLVATEAGATVSDVAGAPLDFSCGMGLERNRGVICASPEVHGRIIEAIDRLGLFPAP